VGRVHIPMTDFPRPYSPRRRYYKDVKLILPQVAAGQEGEGASYTGLKPAGLDLGPAIPAADKALESGNPGPLLKLINGKTHEGIHK